MAASPAHGPAEGDDDLAGGVPTPDPMSAEEWEAWLDHQDEPCRACHNDIGCLSGFSSGGAVARGRGLSARRRGGTVMPGRPAPYR